jgi:hypothetical protein
LCLSIVMPDVSPTFASVSDQYGPRNTKPLNRKL